LVPADPHKPAVLVTTSGTIGEPKCVIHTPAMLSESADMIIGNRQFMDGDIMIVPLPLAHMNGLITMLAFIRLGSPFVLPESFDADNRDNRYIDLHFPPLLSELPTPIQLSPAKSTCGIAPPRKG